VFLIFKLSQMQYDYRYSFFSWLSLIWLLLLPVFPILNSQLLFEIWESHWIKRLLLLLTSTTCAVTVTTSCISSASSPAHFTPTATATLVHSFVSARLDYCSTLYAGLPGLRLGCLERVIRTAARFIGGIPRTGHVSAYMLDVRHWLHFHHWLTFCLAAVVWRCQLGLAPAYLQDLCYPTLGTRGRSALRSMERGVLFVSFARTSTRLVHSWG